MQVLLTQTIERTGIVGEVIEVSDGFARNMLFPKKLAVEATPSAVREIERKRAAEEKQEQERKADALEKAGILRGKVIHMKAKGGSTGRLYGSITTQEVADALKEQHGVDIDKRRIECDPIRQAGDADITIRLYAGITTSMKVHVEVTGR